MKHFLKYIAIALLVLGQGDAFAAKKAIKAKTPTQKSQPKKPESTKAETKPEEAEPNETAIGEYIFQLDDSPTKVTLRMKHFPLGRFDEEGEKALSGLIHVQPNGQVTAEKIEFTVESLKSNVPLRDEHLKKKYLKNETFPKISISHLKTLMAMFGDKTENAFEGTLEVMGNATPIHGEMTLEIKKDVLHGTAKFQSTLNDVKIDPPMYMGIGVRPEYEVLVELQAVPKLDTEEAPKF